MTAVRRRRLLVAALLAVDVALICLLSWMSLFTVEADQVAVVFRHGRPTGRPVCRAGLHAKWPWDDVRLLNRRIRLLQFDPSERLTAQLEPILVQPVVCWRIAEDAAGTFFRTMGDEDSARRCLADLVWASLDAEFPTKPLSFWMGTTDPTDSSTEAALTQTVRQIGWTVRAKAHDLLGINVLDMHLRRLSVPDHAADSIYRQAASTMDTQADRIRLMAQLRVAEAKASAKAEADRIVIEAERKAAVIREEGRAEAEKIHSDARRMNPDLADLMRKIESYRRLVSDNTTIIMTADDSLFGRPAPPPIPPTTQPSQPAR